LIVLFSFSFSLLFCGGVHQVEWLKNDEPLRSNAGERIESIGSYSGLKIHSINFADTGAYMCQASSIGGLARDISSLVVQDDSTPSRFPTSRPHFLFVFFFFLLLFPPSDGCALLLCVGYVRCCRGQHTAVIAARRD
jgi:hypothetical protein